MVAIVNALEGNMKLMHIQGVISELSYSVLYTIRKSQIRHVSELFSTGWPAM